MKLPDSNDTIVAISTPPGYGGIGVVRLSGANALSLAQALIADPLDLSRVRSHSIHHNHIKGSGRKPITDEVLLSVFRAPRSYTGEDVIEISAHGNPEILRQIVELAVAAGCRPAAPGEFTLRAFQSGRLDLMQAEAVADLIAAEGEAFRQAALYQLSGRLSEYIGDLRNDLIEIAALFEAYTDFPEEEIPMEEKKGLLAKLDAIAMRLDQLAGSYQRGQVIRDGIQIPIVGPPNAGKSSLFNAILAEERAIVTEIPGTTRDTIAEKIELNGIVVRFVDTAGLRETSDRIEALGVDRSRREVEAAKIMVLVFDATQAHIADIRAQVDANADKQVVLALNKIDLLSDAQLGELSFEFENLNPVMISARKLIGIDALLGRIATLIESAATPSSGDLNFVTNARHARALSTAADVVGGVKSNLAADTSFEILSFELRQAIDALEEVLGKVTNEDVLAEIFSRFCIGK